jgi:hypothetical protein
MQFLTMRPQSPSPSSIFQCARLNAHGRCLSFYSSHTVIVCLATLRQLSRCSVSSLPADPATRKSFHKYKRYQSNIIQPTPVSKTMPASIESYSYWV